MLNRCLTWAFFFLFVCLIGSLPPFHSNAQEEKKPGKPSGATGYKEKPIKIKRRDDSSDADLEKQLRLATELGFTQNAAGILLANLHEISKKPNAVVVPDIGPRFYLQSVPTERKDFFDLPWRPKVESQIGVERAEKLEVYSITLRASMHRSVPANGTTPDAEKLKSILTESENPKWNKPECVPALTQMLQSESAALRTMLVELLANIEGKEAGIALAQRAIFDLSFRVREQAVAALVKRPRKEYQQIMLDGLRLPWPPAADHAAEAIAALKMEEGVPEMVAMLNEPDPKLPFTKEVNGEKTTYIRELVRLNHLNNCLCCHAPAPSKDNLVRGRVPDPGLEMSPLYYAETKGQFVRADITFLRQDFSLVQPVANPGKWPGHQRFDYLFRARKATSAEISASLAIQKKKPTGSYPQREAVLFSLREVAGRDLGSNSESWLPLLKGGKSKGMK